VTGDRADAEPSQGPFLSLEADRQQREEGTEIQLSNQDTQVTQVAGVPSNVSS
jgi:hypothetical protein